MQRRHRLMTAAGSIAVATAICLVAAGPTASRAQSQESPPVPEALQKLQPVVGDWRADRVEFLDEEGGVREVSQAEARNRSYLGGLAFHHRGRLLEPEIRTQGWYFYDPMEELLHHVSVSSRGHHDEFVGRWEGDRLVMVTEPRAHYQGRLYRSTTYDIRADAFTEQLEISTDGGATWRLAVRQVNRRVESGRDS